MVLFMVNPQRPKMYEKFVHDTPEWFKGAGLGIFAHWGSYSVPAWAQPIGALGTFDDPLYWNTHNPYAEWYWNTMSIEGSPAAEHQREVYGDMPYEDFIDMWKAEAFDPDDMADLFARAGARYFVPTTKHHEGITLWKAPDNEGWNTVDRGPHRDLVGAFADAMRAKGLKFGVYYSSGLDWHKEPNMPILGDAADYVPQSESYARYMYSHVMDLIDKYRPSILWGDIDVPKISEEDNDFSVARLFEHYYDVVPDGVVNDRWGLTHWDFRTVEYEQGKELMGKGMWEMTRGIGYSFGYNQMEDADSYMTGAEAVKLLVDAVSLGGNLLLDIGPDAAGRIPELQRKCLEGMADWMATNSPSVHDVDPVAGARPSGEGADGSDDSQPWIRWTGDDRSVYALIDASGRMTLPIDPSVVDAGSAATLGGAPVAVDVDGDALVAEVPASDVAGPQVVRFARR